MRFTRAAKVAAFPLLALVLVVALIACQGPVGDAGKDGAKGDTGAGKDAPPALDSTTVDIIIFTHGEEDDTDVWATETMMPIDLANAFTGGSADRTYRVQTVINAFGELNYDLDGAELTLSVDDVTFAGENHGDDTVIVVEATDSAGANEVAHVEVRLNQAPVITDATEVIEMTVGTQPAAAPDGDDDGDPDNFNTADTEVECVALNVCTVTLEAMDANSQDTMEWKWHTTSDIIAVTLTEDEDGIMIMGLEDKSGMATVYLWAIDDARSPMNPVDDPETGTEEEPMDESQEFPDTLARIITVTVDGAPYMSNSAVGSVELDVAAVGAPMTVGTVVGYVYDPENDDSNTMHLSYTPAFEPPNGIVEFALGQVAMGTEGVILNSRPIYAMGRNTGVVTVTLTVHEVDPDADAPAQPNQSTSHTITVSVN